MPKPNKNNNRDSERAIILQQAKPCRCGAGMTSLRPMVVLDHDEHGIVCLKCEHFVLGADLTESIKKWNKNS
jgi:hypothetical protein